MPFPEICQQHMNLHMPRFDKLVLVNGGSIRDDRRLVYTPFISITA